MGKKITMAEVILPTKWPLFELHFGIWKLHIKAMAFCPANDSMIYEYIMLVIYWSGKQIFRIRLFDTYARLVERAVFNELGKEELRKQALDKPAVNVNIKNRQVN